MNYLAQTFRAEVRVPQPPLAVWGSLLDFLQNVLKNILVTHGVTKEANSMNYGYQMYLWHVVEEEDIDLDNKV